MAEDIRHAPNASQTYLLFKSDLWFSLGRIRAPLAYVMLDFPSDSSD
jgi:hypothetical protein